MHYHVMVRCPEFDKAVPTGTVCDVKTFEALERKTMRFKCPTCGKSHEWSVTEAWLRDPAYDQIAH
jgi:endogenous inhibitor of DNA gyrase (YacG/DUF329 family)